MLRIPSLAHSTILGSVAFALSFSTPVMAAEGNSEDINTHELLNLSLEQLSNIEVTSVSKRAEKAREAAAAIFVITPDDIRQSGATAIPELLRMVPGLNVAQSGSHQWAISSRGSNDQFSNKLLVLIDGRTVYTPLFSGVFWDVQDTPLQDIERIEVIRGPGATLWGANAVNGVINIITKKAKDTQGTLASASFGSFDNAETLMRYGTKVGDTGHMRVYAKYNDRDEAKTTRGLGAGDNWNKAQSGFRADWESADKESITLQGDAYRAGQSYIFNLPLPAATNTFNVMSDRENATGMNLLGRWEKKLSPDSDITAQLYYDSARRSNFIYLNTIQTVDLEVKQVWTGMDSHEMVWGTGYRFIDSSTRGSPYITFSRNNRQDDLINIFAQDKITLSPKELFLTLGSKFEHNDFTGFEYEPSARLSWVVDDKQTVWGAVSRAVRNPNIALDDIQFVVSTVAPNAMAARLGDRSADSENLISYELGYRIEPRSDVSLDFATFYNDYKQLVLGVQGSSLGPISTSLGTYGLVPVYPVNAGSASSYGFETTAKWSPASYAQLSASYSYLQLKFDQADPFGFSFNGKSPRHQFNLRSSIDLPHDVEFDTSLYFVDNLSRLAIPQYTRLDTKVSWAATENVELSLVGQNLLDNRHKEFSGFLYQSQSEIPRSVYGNVTWKF